MSRYVGAIDQGTTSTRFIVFDRNGATVAVVKWAPKIGPGASVEADAVLSW